MNEDPRPDAPGEPPRAVPTDDPVGRRGVEDEPPEAGADPAAEPGRELLGAAHEAEDEAAADPPAEATGEKDRAAALNAAIGELEQILSEHGLDPLEPAAPGPTPPAGPGAPLSAHGEQYTIPLLHEVVVPDNAEPGTGPARVDEPATAGTGEPGPPLLGARVAPPPPRTEPPPDRVTRQAERYRPLFERLSSEIEVIVETGVEEALRAASKEIVKKVNDHLAIVLPEVLDELSHLDQAHPEQDED